ncbi:MAG TPA: hypothetical protein VF834_21060 [Streptosporangiaceae bacterium]
MRSDSARGHRPGRGRGRGRGAGVPRLSAVAASVLLVAACGSTATGPGGGPGAGHSPGNGGRAAIAIARDSSNGATVRMRVGGRLELTLSSTYWQVRGSSAPAVLRQDGPARVLPRPGTCPAIPGLGCAPVRVLFTALAPGTAVISASRTTCGEALACRPDQRHFSVTIVVR